jgi:hypothetical protein
MAVYWHYRCWTSRLQLTVASGACFKQQLCCNKQNSGYTRIYKTGDLCFNMIFSALVKESDPSTCITHKHVYGRRIDVWIKLVKSVIIYQILSFVNLIPIVFLAIELRRMQLNSTEDYHFLRLINDFVRQVLKRTFFIYQRSLLWIRRVLSKTSCRSGLAFMITWNLLLKNLSQNTLRYTLKWYAAA